jgi:hypothetical protein
MPDCRAQPGFYRTNGQPKGLRHLFLCITFEVKVINQQLVVKGQRRKQPVEVDCVNDWLLVYTAVYRTYMAVQVLVAALPFLRTEVVNGRTPGNAQQPRKKGAFCPFVGVYVHPNFYECLLHYVFGGVRGVDYALDDAVQVAGVPVVQQGKAAFVPAF